MNERWWVVPLKIEQVTLGLRFQLKKIYVEDTGEWIKTCLVFNFRWESIQGRGKIPPNFCDGDVHRLWALFKDAIFKLAKWFYSGRFTTHCGVDQLLFYEQLAFNYSAKKSRTCDTTPNYPPQAYPEQSICCSDVRDTWLCSSCFLPFDGVYSCLYLQGG